MINKKFTLQNLLFSLLAASVFALALAYISQYFLGFQPCHLCFWQRKPFWIIIVLAAVFLAIPRLKKYQNLAIKIAVLLLLINAGIAFYHAGVEKKWFKGLESCAVFSSPNSNNPTTLEDLKRELENSKIVRCDQPQFIFLGISMAGWNMIYCLFAAFFTCLGLRQYKKVPKIN